MAKETEYDKIAETWDERKRRELTPEVITGDTIIRHSVELCDKCKGLGFIEREELVDYHKRDYAIFREECETCEGDGRIILIREYLTFNHNPNRHDRKVPYSYWKDYIDPHLEASRWFRMRLDRRDIQLEAKYPDLAAMSYDKYDDLAEKYRLIEVLKKEEVNESR
jgi:hypothetical protein